VLHTPFVQRQEFAVAVEWILAEAEVLQTWHATEQVGVETAELVARQVEFDKPLHLVLAVEGGRRQLVTGRVTDRLDLVLSGVEVYQCHVTAVEDGPVDLVDLVETDLQAFEAHEVLQREEVNGLHVRVLQTEVLEGLVDA